MENEEIKKQELFKERKNLIYDFDKVLPQNRNRYKEIQNEILEIENKMSWISVKDRLPLYKQVILVFIDNKNICDAVYRGEYEPGLHAFRIELTREDIFCQIGERITHWMPLPEAPK